MDVIGVRGSRIRTDDDEEASMVGLNVSIIGRIAGMLHPRRAGYTWADCDVDRTGRSFCMYCSS